MIREIVGARTVASLLMPNKRRKKISNATLGMIGTAATIAGLGAAAYMVFRPKNTEE